MMPDIHTEMQKVIGATDNMPQTTRAVPQVKPQEQTAAPKRIMRNRIQGSIAPVNELVHVLGTHVAAGKAIGLTPSGISTILAHGKCSKSVEIAAMMTLKEIERRREGHKTNVPVTRVVMMRVPAAKMSGVAAMCQAMSIELIDINELLDKEQ